MVASDLQGEVWFVETVHDDGPFMGVGVLVIGEVVGICIAARARLSERARPESALPAPRRARGALAD
jgi:hypothetical protein